MRPAHRNINIYDRLAPALVPDFEVAAAPIGDGAGSHQTKRAYSCLELFYSRYALHHLPDFWKALALARVAEMLRPGGVFRLSDVVYGFEPHEAEHKIDAWIAEATSDGVEQDWTRAELAEHVRDEGSTFTWLLEPMIERAGLEIVDAQHDASGIFARYVCRRPQP